MRAGVADLDEPGPDAVQGREVELVLGVEPPGARRAPGRQQPAGSDDLAGRLLAHEQVAAARVEGVDVAPGVRARQQRARLPGEDVVAQPLRCPYVLLVAGEGDRVAAGRGGLLGGGPRSVRRSRVLSWSRDGAAPVLPTPAVLHMTTAGKADVRFLKAGRLHSETGPG